MRQLPYAPPHQASARQRTTHEQAMSDQRTGPDTNRQSIAITVHPLQCATLFALSQSPVFIVPSPAGLLPCHHIAPPGKMMLICKGPFYIKPERTGPIENLG